MRGAGAITGRAVRTLRCHRAGAVASLRALRERLSCAGRKLSLGRGVSRSLPDAARSRKALRRPCLDRSDGPPHRGGGAAPSAIDRCDCSRPGASSPVGRTGFQCGGDRRACAPATRRRPSSAALGENKARSAVERGSESPRKKAGGGTRISRTFGVGDSSGGSSGRRRTNDRRDTRGMCASVTKSRRVASTCIRHASRARSFDRERLTHGLSGRVSSVVVRAIEARRRDQSRSVPRWGALRREARVRWCRRKDRAEWTRAMPQALPLGALPTTCQRSFGTRRSAPALERRWERRLPAFGDRRRNRSTEQCRSSGRGRRC